MLLLLACAAEPDSKSSPSDTAEVPDSATDTGVDPVDSVPPEDTWLGVADIDCANSATATLSDGLRLRPRGGGYCELGLPRLPGRPAFGDVDHDGDDDVVLVLPADNQVLAYLSNPSFPPTIGVPATLDAIQLTLADLDADGNLDAVGAGASGLSVARGDGVGGFEDAGTLTPLPCYPGWVGAAGSTIAVGCDDELVLARYDGDAFTLTEADTPGAVAWTVADATPYVAADGQLLRVGSDGTSEVVAGDVGLTIDLAAGDLDGDGVEDLALTRDGGPSDELIALIADGDSFARATLSDLGPGGGALLLVDADANGADEVYAVDNDVEIFDLAGDSSGVRTWSGSVYGEFGSAQVMGDAAADVIGLDGAQLSYRANVGGEIDPGSLGGDIEYGESFVAWDADSDGRTDDLVWPLGDDLGVATLDDDFRPTRSIVPVTAGVDLRHLAVADVDGDGVLDLVGGDTAGGGLVVMMADGVGGLRDVHVVAGGGFDDEPAVADLDGDGHLDVALASVAGDRVDTFLGDGTGAFAYAASTETGGAPNLIQWADLNADGAPDLVGLDGGDDLWTFVISDGTGGYVPRTDAPVPDDFADVVAVGDLTGDGAAEVLSNSVEPGEVEILLNDGTGAFTRTRTNTDEGATIADLGVSDFDGDGWGDIVVVDYDGVSVLRSDGAGHGDDLGFVTATISPYHLVLTDQDADGDTDLVISVTLGGAVMIENLGR